MQAKEKHSKIKNILIWITSIFLLLFITLCLCVVGMWLGNPFIKLDMSILGVCVCLIALNIFSYFFWCKSTQVVTKSEFWLCVLSQLVAIIYMILIS